MKEKKKKKVTHPVKKGTKYELAIVHKICDTLGLFYGGDLKRRPRGEPGNDIVHLSELSMEIFPFSVESKDRIQWDIKGWWDKLAGETSKDLTPILVLHRPKSKQDFVIMDMKDFLRLVKDLNIGAEKK